MPNSASCLKQFVNKVVLITGAASGIGASTAQLFAKNGAIICLVDKEGGKLKKLEEKCNCLSGQDTLTFPCDVTEDKLLKYVVETTIKKKCKLDVLVHNASKFVSDKTETTSIECFQSVFNNNVRSIINLSIYAIPHLIKSKGNVICVSSAAGIRAFPNLLSFSVTNSAIDQFVRCSSLDLAPKGVRVNGVNPGILEFGKNYHGISKLLRGRAKKTHPLGRAGKPEEVASLIAFLASSRADWITGACFSVDGGWQLKCPI